MLAPYESISRYRHEHHRVVSQQQEPPLPNPSELHMAPAASPADEYVHLFTAGMYQQETLEAVLRQPVTAPVPADLRAGNELPATDGGDGGHGGPVGTPRRRPFRTDRHSKIRTAQGVRDRRMRLSVGVARDFFALQDLLGFDKASTTVDWLLTQSRPAIERLSGAAAPGAPITRRPVSEKGDAASSSSTDCFGGATASERMKSIGGDGGSQMVLMAERGGDGEVDWFMSETTDTAAVEQPAADELDCYYQYYQLEEMMRAATAEEY